MNFPLASSEIIKTHAIEFKIPDNNLKEMISKCSLKESSGIVSPKVKKSTFTYGSMSYKAHIKPYDDLNMMVIEWKDQLEAF